MIEFHEAYDLVLKHSGPVGTELIKIEESTGRILAENVRADTDMPPFDKSAMDGYAVRSSDTEKDMAPLKVISRIKAGAFPRKHVRAGTAAEIMTGAPIPPGADAVVMVENTVKAGSSLVRVNSRLKKGKNICKKGEDIKKGTIVLKKGKIIRAPEIAVMASVGRRSVKVFKMPEVSVLATGDELVSHPRPIKKGRIRNSNSPMLGSLLRFPGLKVNDLGIAGDRHDELKEKIMKGLGGDMLILSGGVSMGQYDLVPRVFRECGIKNIFHKVAIKPGKPLFFGKKGNTMVFGAPGNPVSVLVAFLLFVRPAIRRICGDEVSAGPLRGILSGAFRTRGDRRTYYPVKVEFTGNRYRLSPLDYHGSADISAVTNSDGFMVVEKGITRIRKGEEVEFIFINADHPC